MGIVITVSNQKGGVGKTTATVSLAGAYARLGLKTLVVDMDPQGSLTRGLISSAWTDRLAASATVAALFGDEVAPPGRIIQPTAFAGLSLLPGSQEMRALNRLEPREYGARLFALRDLLGELDYERVLIDNPPNLEFCSLCSMTAADYLLLPFQPEDYGAQGVQFVMQAAKEIRAGANPRLQILGLLRTMHQPRSAVHVVVAERFRQDFPGLLFDASMPYAAQMREAVMARTPIGFYKPRGAPAKAVAAIVEEMDARIARLCAAEMKGAV